MIQITFEFELRLRSLARHVFLCGSQVSDYVTSCILAGGGLRSMVMYDGVTTAVLGAQATPKYV